MALVPTNQADVLQAAVDRLIANMTAPAVTSSTCFISLDPEIEVQQRSSSLYIMVSPMDSQFDQDRLLGGGENNCLEESGITVTIRSAMKLDKTGAAREALVNATRGMLVVKQEVLRVLTGQQLQNDAGDDLLTSLIAPLNGDRGKYVDSSGMFQMSVSFALDYEWDLS